MKTVLTVLALVVLGYIVFTNMSGGNSADRLDAETFKQKYEETPGVVIDVRTKGEYDSGHLALADYNYDVTSGEFSQKLSTLDKDKTYYLYCRSGNRSGKAAKMMKQEGFEQVYNIGGFSSLVQAGLEAEK